MTGSFLDDKGSVDCAEPDIAALGDCSGLVFSLLDSDMLRVVGKEESKGEVAGIETSLRRPCEPAPAVLFESSRSLISMGIVDCGCELEEGSLDVMPCPAPGLDWVDDAIGWVFCRFYGR